MKKLRSLSLWALAGVVCCAVSCSMVFSQSAAPAVRPQVRIVSHIDESNLVTLKGNVNPHAIAKYDRGPVSGDLQMAGLTLILSRSADQQAAFDAFVASQYDSSSPNFHQWLTPSAIGERFGPAQSDIATISGWLSSHGFAVKSVAADRMTIQFSGTAGQVQSAFHTTIHNLNVNGAAHIANMTDPQIPAALAPVVVGIKGLHNFFPHPLHRMGNKVQFNADVNGWQKLESSPAASLAAGGAKAQVLASSPNPNFYYPITSNGATVAVQEDVAPSDFAAIYNLQPLWSSSITGSGQTIAIIGTSDINLTDVSNFKTAFGLPVGKAPVIAHGPDGDPGICTNAANICGPGDLDENSLDVEWSGAVAPGAQIVLVTDAYNSNNPQLATNDPIFDGAQWVVDNAYVQGSAVYGSRIMSLSYGQCELFSGTASNVAYNNLWQTAASAGIAVFVASGDSGAPACDQGGDAGGVPYTAQYGEAVNSLASTPYNTAVGGTDFSWCKPSYTIVNNQPVFQGCASTNATPYWNTSNNSTTQASAKGYVPETPWNDSCLNPIWAAYFESIAPIFSITAPTSPEAACNFIYNDWASVDQQNESGGGGQFVMAWGVDSAGGGGGASNCVVNTTSVTSTQAGTCTAGATSTGASYGNLRLVNDGWPKPGWQAGVSGIPSDGVRDLPDVSFFAGAGSFDSATLICVSNDGAGCTSIANTGSSTSGGAEEVGGTSVATPEMAGVMALINQKANAPQGNPDAALYMLATKQPANCSAETGSTSNGCYFNDVDQGTIAMPCNYQGKAAEGGAVFNGQSWESTQTYTGLASPNCSASGSDVVGTLNGYSAAAGYDLATGLGSLNIANVVNDSNAWIATAGTAAASVSVSLGGVTSVKSNQTLSVAVTVSGSSGTPTGDVTLTATNTNGYSFAQILSGGATTFTIPVYTFTSGGTVTLTAIYSGDDTYASNSGTQTVAVTYVPPPTYSLTTPTNPAAVNPGASATATISGATSTSGYAGTVTFTSCTQTSSSVTNPNAPPSCSVSGTITYTAGNPSGTATATVTTTPGVAKLAYPKVGNGKGWMGAGGGAVLALLVFFGIPARRRSWRAMLGMVVLLVTLGSLAACGGGGSSGGGGGVNISGTSKGTYTFTVSGVGNDQFQTKATTTFTVTVN